MTKPSILMTVAGLNIGGTELHILSITEELIRQGYDVNVLSLSNGILYKEFLSLGCNVYINFDQTEQSLNKIMQIIKLNNINIIHSHDNSVSLMQKVSNRMNIPLVYTVHGTYYNIQSMLEPKTTKFVSVSPPIKQWLESMNISSKIIPNGIDLNKYYLKKSNIRTKLSIPNNAPVILYASRLGDSIKSYICKMFIEAGLQARKKFPNLQMIIVGDSNNDYYLKPIRYLVKSANFTSSQNFIHMLGNRRDMPELYSSANCVVGTGRVALEAMACEKPVIAIGVRGFFGLVKPNNYNQAWLQNFGDHQGNNSLSSHLITSSLNTILLSANKQKLLGKSGRNFVATKFGINPTVKQLLHLYKDTLNS